MYDEKMLGKEIKAHRAQREWTQKRLADELTKRGIPAQWSTIAKIEAGTRPVRGVEIAALADAFDMSLDALVGRIKPVGDIPTMRKGLTNTATNCERLLSEMAEAVESITERCRLADTEGVLQRVTDAGNLLHGAIQQAVMQAGQMIREGQSK
jgi:transcriptional regulator with XRE-family HTH domain